MNESSNDPNPTAPFDPAADLSSNNPDAHELASARAQAAENFDRMVRLTADFDNFKKRAAREREEVRRATYESLLSRLIPVLDNFEMALVAADQPQSNIQSIRSGVSMIYQQLKGVFSDAGLEEISSQGLPFDPALHEAVSEQESTSHPEGTVIHQIRKGYRLRERLLRPASVVVSKLPEPKVVPVEG